MNQKELYNSFVALVEGGDEAAAKQFLIDHLTDFPEEVRKEIAFSFFTDAVKNEAAIAGVEKEGLEKMKDLDEVAVILADALKASELKEGL